MNLRPPADADRQAIFSIHQAAARQFGSKRYTSAEIESWVAQLTPAVYEFSGPDRRYVVAEHQARVVGFGCVNLGAAEIEAVYVAPEFSGRGFASKILEELERIAQAQDIRQIHLSSSLNAVGFYERAGFTFVERGTYPSPGGLELSVVKMTKSLRPSPPNVSILPAG